MVIGPEGTVGKKSARSASREGETGIFSAALGDYGYLVRSPDLGEIYDYLLTFGDAKWTAPRVDRGVVRVVAPPSTPLPEAKEKPPVKPLPRVAPKK